MANNFVIRKRLIVSGSDIQPLTMQGTTGQLFSVASSSQGNTLTVNNISGIPLLKVSGSELTLGLTNYSGSRAIQFSQSFLQVTGSALLDSTRILDRLQIGPYFKAYSGTLLEGRALQLSFGIQGEYAHAEGVGAAVYEDQSHAEGQGSATFAYWSHAEGGSTLTRSTGVYSHAEGANTQTLGTGSHAEGSGSIASGSFQHVTGQNNATSSEQSAFIHGNGTSNTAKRNLIYAYGTGSNGVVEISGSLIVVGGITGSYSTQIFSQTVGTYTFKILDSGQEFLFRNDCDITLPSGLQPGFVITATTLDTVVYLLTGSGVTLINNKGTTIPMKSSATIVNTGTANEYLVLGDL